MIYLIVWKNRYALSMLISIFFGLSVEAQINSSRVLKDSVESITPFPDAAVALPLYQKINLSSKKHEDRDLELYSKIYISYFNDVLGNTFESDEAIEEAFKFAQDTTGISTANLITTYQWMQQLERKRGNLINANELNKRYIELELATGANDVAIGVSYLELASSYRILGDFENAILYPTKAISLFEKAPDSLFSKSQDKYLRLVRSLQIRGLAKRDLKDYNGAIEDFNLSIKYLKKSKNYDGPKGKKFRIDCYSRLTEALILNNELAKASETLQILAPNINPTDYRSYRYYELLSLLSFKKNNLSNTSGNIQTALTLAQTGLIENRESPEIARLFMLYGDYCITKDSLQQGLGKYHRGLQYFDSNLDDNYSNNPNTSLVAKGKQILQLLERKAGVFIKLYNQNKNKDALLDGISTYNSALDLIDKMKTDYINEGSKYRVTEIASSIFSNALDANFSLYQIDRSEASLNSIFKIIEKNKAEILFQNINSKYNLLASALPEDLIKKGIDLKYNISYYSKLLSEEKLSKESNENKIEKYKDKLFKLNEGLTFHDQKIKDEYPEFYNFKNEIGNVISVAELKGALKDDQLIVEFFQTTNHLYVLSVSNDKVAIRRKSMSEIRSVLNDYFLQLSKPPSDNKSSVISMEKQSQSLAKHLMLEDENYHSNLEKIIIVPDGDINRIPFESLIIDDVGKFLIEASNVTYNYSASQFLINKKSPELKNPSVLCQTPTFDGLASEQRSCNSNVLGELPYVKAEFDYLKSNFSGSFFDNESASTTNLKSQFSDHEIIHLATHACLNNDDPMLSQIYFSDGSMTNYDIQNLNSRPELVVLSACNTASGIIKNGEGVIGLSRGFFEAGVKGMQSSLWSIDDLSSSKIVTGMYGHLKQGKSKSEALRQSKLAYLKEADKLRSHPYYWAALIHIGNDNPISFSSNSKSFKELSILLIFIFGIGLYFYFRSRRMKNKNVTN